MITRDKEFHLNFWPFFATVLLQNVMVMSVNLLDNLMLGGFSEAALSGAAVVNQIQFILLSVINGAGDGLVVLCSQYWGQNRGKPIQRITSIALWLAVGLSMVLFVLVSAFPYQALRLFTPDAEIVAQGVEYLSVIKYTYPLLAISTILLAMLRSVQTVKITLAIAASSLGINAVLNYALIYGNFGAPALGAAGAAWATLVSRVVELGIIVVFLMKWEKKLRVEPRLLAVPDKALSSDYLRVSLPTLIIGFQWGLNISLQTAILGHMDAPGVIAANSVAANLVMFLKVIAISAASSAGVLIGKTVGKGDIAKVKEYVKSLQWIFLAVGIFSGAGVLLLRIPLLGLYNITESARSMAWDFLTVLAFTTLGMSYQMPALGGVVRGGGDTRFVMINDLISVWGIVIPLSWLAAFVFKWPPIAVVACLNSDQVFKCLPAVIKVNSYNWIKRLTRDEPVAAKA